MCVDGLWSMNVSLRTYPAVLLQFLYIRRSRDERSYAVILSCVRVRCTCILPIFLYGSECWAVTKSCTRRRRPMVFAKVVRNQMVPSRAEWQGETDNRATPPVGYCPSTASFSVRPRAYCKNARRDRCQEYHNCFSFGELEETTRTSSNYMDEDYPARPEIKQSLPGWGDNSTVAQNRPLWRLMSAFGATHPQWCLPHKKKRSSCSGKTHEFSCSYCVTNTTLRACLCVLAHC